MPPPYRTTTASRERNRVHAQKTRMRKKEQMQVLQAKAAELKEEQIRLKQTINEKNTASILIGLFSEGSPGPINCRGQDEPTTGTIGNSHPRLFGSTKNVANAAPEDDPKVEELLRRSPDDIPDSTKIPELPALILPGQHASKKMKAANAQLLQHQEQQQKHHLQVSPSSSIVASDSFGSDALLTNDGIDYQLLGRDRLQCTPEELDLIRRERNRMHAKRTRDRKRIFTEKLAELCRELEEENTLLLDHLSKIDPDYSTSPIRSSNSVAVYTTASFSSFSSSTTSARSSPESHPTHGDLNVVPTMHLMKKSRNDDSEKEAERNNRIMILSLLKAAAEQELHEISDAASSSGGDDELCSRDHASLVAPSNAKQQRKRLLSSLSVV